MADISLEMLNKFLDFVKREQLREAPENLLYYGTGEAAHWPVQSNLNIAASFAVAGAVEEDQEKIDIALKLFRYSFRTHLAGDMCCSCGGKWGRHWISVLGLERAAHAINAIEKYFTSQDLELYRRVRESEADFLLSYEVLAGMNGKEGKNKPESNVWNGGFLWRCALDYPDSPEVEKWKEKGTKLLLNGISAVEDAQSDKIYEGKPLREWHVGPNFTPNYSLDHHGYMNTGYSFVTLSNVAMLHFNFKQKNQTPPEALYLHAADLWKVIKNFIFDDGRMLRIGGYNRMRYAYCQWYMIPAMLFAADCLGDADALALSRNCLELLNKEQTFNGDGSFSSKRLEALKKYSYYYYTRSESDPAVVLSQELLWKKLFNLVPKTQCKLPDFVWSEEFHGAHLIKNSESIRSFAMETHRFAGPMVLCLAPDRSDMAEWQSNFLTRYVMARAGFNKIWSYGRQENNFFWHTGKTEWYNDIPLGEGEQKYPFVSSSFAVAALPDNRSMLVLEISQVIKENMFEEIVTLNCSIPNDLFNGCRRTYTAENFKYESDMLPKEPLSVDTGSRKVTVDGRLTVANISNQDTLHIIKPANRSAHVVDKAVLKSLNIEFISTRPAMKFYHAHKGEVLYDGAVAAAVDAPADFACDSSSFKCGNIRAAEITGVDGVRYFFVFNAGDEAASWQNMDVHARQALLGKVENGSYILL